MKVASSAYTSRLIRSEERRVGKESRYRCDWSSDVCSSDLERVCPALSMYIEVDGETLAILNYESRVERIHIAANLRHDTLEPLFNEETLAAGKLDYPYASELTLLWNLVQKLETVRGKPSDNSTQQMDYNFHIESEELLAGHPSEE